MTSKKMETRTKSKVSTAKGSARDVSNAPEEQKEKDDDASDLQEEVQDFSSQLIAFMDSHGKSVEDLQTIQLIG